MCSYNDLKSLYNRVIPAIKGFEENMITLEKDMSTSKEIVRRFDEILIEKASKLSVDKLIDDVKKLVSINDYSDYKIAVNLTHQKIGSDFEQLCEKMNDISKSIHDEISIQLK